MTKKMNKNTLQGTGEGVPSEASLIPSQTLKDKFHDILVLVKSTSTYVQKIFSAVLVLQYQLVNEEMRSDI